MYRIAPAAAHDEFRAYDGAPHLLSAPISVGPTSPNRLRWDPLPFPTEPTDFVDGLMTYAANGDVAQGDGSAIHLYAVNRSMTDRAFFNSDGEMLIVPQSGELRIVTELGIIDVEPLQIAVIPRGVRFRVELVAGPARGYVCENYGMALRLPELGPIGSNGLANTRDFETPVAAFEDRQAPYELIQKFNGGLWITELAHSPFDVVAWHGNLAPYRYDLRRFMAINTVTFDHPDPSINTVLTSPSHTPGVANVEFVIFPPRWSVAEDTFRPPWYHRNVMTEFMGLIEGAYDAKAEGFLPGGCSLHNAMNAHGPDSESYRTAISAKLQPVRTSGTMAFMFESRSVLRPSDWALNTPQRQPHYDESWEGFERASLTGAS